MENERDKLIDINLKDEMKTSYLDYAMSVIVSRALPDVRDGLKPVHRRILYAMDELNMPPDKPHRKSARVVGDVLGKYHPHGDSSVYGAMVRLAQDFNTRYLLVDGHGNFGSVDGDSAAAMRYTEARLTKLAMEMMRDIGKETVDYKPNFDESLMEPVVLPSRFPNLLVNGSSGIAVGMATNMPPHNLREVIEGIDLMIENPDVSIEELSKVIKGPDFPTGANIMGKEGIRRAYKTGRGKIRMRAVAEIEESSKGKHSIIVTEIPYQVNKARLIEKIAEYVRDKKLEGISDLRDESDREGMRIVIEVRRDANPKVVLNNLFKHTQLQATFGIINLALVDGQPKVLNLKQILHYYLEHQKEIIIRRTKFDLAKAEARAHIVEGLRIALDNIDRIIKIIRASSDDQSAREALMSTFEFSEIQAQAILDMRLKRLTSLESDKLNEEYEALIKQINWFKEILGSEKVVLGIIKEELLEIKEKYGDMRKTRIMLSADEINMEDMIEDEDVVITLTHFGYIKRMPEGTYRPQKRGGRGVIALSKREEDFVEDLYITSTHSTILFFTSKGRVFSLKAYEIPEGSRIARGTAIVNLLSLNPDERVSAIIPLYKHNPQGYLVMATRDGTVKKTELSQFENIRKTGIIGITLRDDDELISVKLTDGEEDLILVTKKGMAIRFNEKDVRDMGRTAMGVKGISLKKDDLVVSMEIVEKDKHLLVISEKGFGKRTLLDEYKTQIRGGKGLITYSIKEKTGDIVSARVVSDQDEIMIISLNGTIIRLGIKDISIMGRNTQGVTLMRMKDDKVVAVAQYIGE